MKAEIDENGKLSVIPETRIESFALARWWTDYQAQNNDVGGEDHFAILEIGKLNEPNVSEGRA